MSESISIVLPIHRIPQDINRILVWLPELPMEYQLIIAHDIKSREFSPLETNNLKAVHQNLKIVEGYFGGPGNTRNEGLRLVNSSYVAFWDADDLPSITNFNEMYEQFRNSHYEIAVGGYSKLNVKNNKMKIILPNQDALLYQIAGEVALWRFIFKTQTVHGIKFPKLYMAEDQIFVSNVFSSIEKIKVFRKVVYNYTYNNNGQLTSGVYDYKIFVEAIKLLFSDLKKKDLQQQNFAKLLIIRLCLTLLINFNFKQIVNVILSITHLLLRDFIDLKFNLFFYSRFLISYYQTRFDNT